MKKISTQAHITRVSSRADGGLGLGLVTPELSTAEKAEFMELHNQLVSLEIEPLDFGAADHVVISKDLDVKSPSQRLRNVIYAYWAQNEIGGDFETYYRKQMELLISKYKDQLN